MLFSSPIFLFLFLPTVLVGYFLLFRKHKNLFLILASLFFYAWGETTYIFLLLGIILINYLFALRISKRKKGLDLWFYFGILTNLGILVYFKYLVFFASFLLKPLVLLNLSLPSVSLYTPLGISFITFHALSYLIDVKRKTINPEKKFSKFLLYMCLFPHLIAGPIVRFKDIGMQIRKRGVSLELFSSGLARLAVGLAKKVVIADTCATVADRIFAIRPYYLSSELLWIALLAYTLQIYFDFSGYSDMAIGLAKMFGFNFNENFNYPYVSRSIQEFWKRWHMTLSSWFRDYVYIPLGGSQRGLTKTCLNILIVFTLTGLWHGASWHFVMWGLYYGILLVLERLFLGKFLARSWKPIQYLYTIFAVMIGWLIFRTDSLNYTLFLLKIMFGLTPGNHTLSPFIFVSNYQLLILIIAIFTALPVVSKINQTLSNHQTVLQFGKTIFIITLFIYSIISVAGSTFAPFIYFRF